MRLSRRARLAERLFSLSLLAYPRAFRSRFAAEMRADFRRARAAGGTGERATLRTVGANLGSGLAERGAAMTRWLFWPTDQRHLYEPRERHAMLWDSVRFDLRYAARMAVRMPLSTALAVVALARHRRQQRDFHRRAVRAAEASVL